MKYLVALLLLASATASATTGFLQGQYQDGGDTHCIYDALGHKYDENIGLGICPLTIEV